MKESNRSELVVTESETMVYYKNRSEKSGEVSRCGYMEKRM